MPPEKLHGEKESFGFRETGNRSVEIHQSRKTIVKRRRRSIGISLVSDHDERVISLPSGFARGLFSGRLTYKIIQLKFECPPTKIKNGTFVGKLTPRRQSETTTGHQAKRTGRAI